MKATNIIPLRRFWEFGALFAAILGLFFRERASRYDILGAFEGARMTQERQHVLVWVAPQFLESGGISRLLREAEFFSLTDEEWGEFVEASVKAGGFALSGRLVESNHGAGIWISPLNIQGLELMIPWGYVRSVVTAQDPESPRMFGLMNELAHGPAAPNGLSGPKVTP